jgi:hypothetical protein
MRSALCTTRLAAAFAALAILSTPAVVSANVVSFGAQLDGLHETPPNGSPGTGNALITIDTTADTVSFNVPFANLASPGTDSHIHFGAPGQAGPVLMPLESLNGSTSGMLKGTVNASSLVPDPVDHVMTLKDLVSAGQAGNLYVNLHSQLFPAGEIRGQLAAVPEPSTMALMLAGLAGALASALGRCRSRSR